MDVYPVVNQLAPLVSYDFSFSTSGSHYRISSHPEPQLLSLLIVAVKLCYPFGPLIRCPRSLTEPAALGVDWEEWAVIQQDGHSHPDTRSRDEGKMAIEDDDVFGMTKLQMDAYLNWYETTWLDEEARENDAKALPKQLLDMFPTDRPGGPADPGAASPSEGDKASTDGEAALTKVQQVQRSMETRPVVLDGEIDGHAEHLRRPGSYYKRYRAVEDMPPDARAFFAAAARVVGLSLRSVVDAVYQAETKLEVWKLARRKADAKRTQETD